MNASYEIQFGHLERPTHCNTTWDWAKYEVGTLFSLFVCLSVWLALCLCLAFWLSGFLSVSVCVSVCLAGCVWLAVWLFVSFCFSVCLSLFLLFFLSICLLSGYLHLSVCLSAKKGNSNKSLHNHAQWLKISFIFLYNDWPGHTTNVCTVWFSYSNNCTMVKEIIFHSV